MDLAKLKTDAKLENEGAWCPIDDTTSLLIGATGSRAYKAAARKTMRPYANIVNTVGVDAIPEPEQERIAIKVLADSVLLGWKGMTMDGREVPYSKDNAIELLTNLPRFRDLVEREAAKISNFQIEAIEVGSKNSEPVSGGDSATSADRMSGSPI